MNQSSKLKLGVECTTVFKKFEILDETDENWELWSFCLMILRKWKSLSISSVELEVVCEILNTRKLGWWLNEVLLPEQRLLTFRGEKYPHRWFQIHLNIKKICIFLQRHFFSKRSSSTIFFCEFGRGQKKWVGCK